MKGEAQSVASPPVRHVAVWDGPRDRGSVGWAAVGGDGRRSRATARTSTRTSTFLGLARTIIAISCCGIFSPIDRSAARARWAERESVSCTSHHHAPPDSPRPTHNQPVSRPYGQLLCTHPDAFPSQWHASHAVHGTPGGCGRAPLLLPQGSRPRDDA